MFKDSSNVDDDDFFITFKSEDWNRTASVGVPSTSTKATASTSTDAFKKPVALPQRGRGYQTNLYGEFKSESRGLDFKLNK